jgi:FtsP/CotA-like multicopper oxidase with cupredoxin domain
VQNRQSSPSPLPASLIEPKIKESSNGLLEVELIASKSSNLVDNIKEGFSYNNTYPGPIIKLKAGDVLKIKLTNKTSEDTNLYFQGIQALAETSPSNLSVKVSPNSSFIYKYQLPESHPGGIYMYHPLLYGRSEKQVVNGMVGAVVVKGTIDELPGIKGLPERLLILSTLSSRSEIQSPTVRLVNGQRNPLFIIRPGEIQRWRILNASANDFYYLAIPGVSFAIIARDGNTTQKPIFTQSELMAPGDSIEILIIGPPPGTYRVVSLPFDQGSIRYPQDQFMTIRSEGEPISGFIMPESLLKYENLQKVKVDNKRKFIFTVEKTSNMQRFLINGKTFDSNRVDLTVKQNAIEEWRVENLSQEWLAFSLQGFPFQVIEVNGVPIERFGLDNTFGIPPKSIIVLRIHFKDFYGKFLLFSRVLFQADHGMMQVVQVMHSNVPKE